MMWSLMYVWIQFQSQQAYTAAAAAAAGQQQGYYNQMGYWGYPQGYQPPAAGMQGYGMQPYAATAMQQGGYATAGYGGMPMQVRTYHFTALGGNKMLVWGAI